MNAGYQVQERQRFYKLKMGHLRLDLVVSTIAAKEENQKNHDQAPLIAKFIGGLKTFMIFFWTANRPRIQKAPGVSLSLEEEYSSLKMQDPFNRFGPF